MTFRIAHLSDLHFGAHDPSLAESILRILGALRPDLAILSGDFTQIGSTSEFRQAQNFIRGLPCEVLCVPGNHDVPARDVFGRFYNPYRRYKNFIAEDLSPIHETKDFLIAGINSARRALWHWNWANGAVSAQQCAYLREIFAQRGAGKWKICVLHHPVHDWPDAPLQIKVFGQKAFRETLREVGVDLVLTGHMHVPWTPLPHEPHQKTNRKEPVFCGAPSAFSSRLRGRANGFHILDFSDKEFQIHSFEEKDKLFERIATADFPR